MKKVLQIIVALLCITHVFAQTYSTTTVYTPRGSSVQGLALTSGDWSNSQKTSIKNTTLSTYPNVTFLADATHSYNCHSYAWHLTEGQSYQVWINEYDASWNPNVYKYFNDGSFIQVCNESDADKVHYYSGDHSAVNSTVVSGKYESKWGANIRVRHNPTDVPSIYNGSFRNYYASTKITGSTCNLCSGNRTFSVKNIAGASYSWTFSSGISAVGSTTSSSLTVQRNGSGDGYNWVEVQITSPCSGTPVTTRTYFNVGIPFIEQVVFANGANGDGYFCNSHVGNQFEPIFACATDGSIEYRLLSYPNLNVVYTSPFPHAIGGPISVGSNFTPGWYVLEINLTTPCGSTGWVGYEVEFVNCAFMRSGQQFKVQASPNPTTSDLYVTLENESPTVKALGSTEPIRYVLYDLNKTQAVKQWTFSNDQKQYKLNVSGIRPGQYVLAVTKGKFTHSTQIVIK